MQRGTLRGVVLGLAEVETMDRTEGVAGRLEMDDRVLGGIVRLSSQDLSEAS